MIGCESASTFAITGSSIVVGQPAAHARDLVAHVGRGGIGVFARA